MKDGRRFGGPPNPYTPPEIPDGKVDVTDPDSKRIKANDTYVQGYNAQAVVDEGQIVLAAVVVMVGRGRPVAWRPRWRSTRRSLACAGTSR
jgi:hypothetical protein